jgi:hypothetical protein
VFSVSLTEKRVPGAHADVCDLVVGSSGVVRAACGGEGPGAKLVTA